MGPRTAPQPLAPVEEEPAQRRVQLVAQVDHPVELGEPVLQLELAPDADASGELLDVRMDTAAEVCSERGVERGRER